MSLLQLVMKLYTYPALRQINLDGITTFARLISHLKRDILQPQPAEHSDPDTAPMVLPQSVSTFLSRAVGIPEESIGDFWVIFKDYAWSMPIVPLIGEDYDAFKRYGWSCGLS